MSTSYLPVHVRGVAILYMRGVAILYMRGVAILYMRGVAILYMRGVAVLYMRGGKSIYHAQRNGKFKLVSFDRAPPVTFTICLISHTGNTWPV